METPYPVLACGRCGRATGWLGPEGFCADCMRAEQLHDAYTDAHAGWVPQAPLELPLPEQPPPLAARAAAALGLRGALERALAVAWARHVDPGETGPPRPVEGYEVEVATKADEPAPDGSGVLVRFRPRRYRFAAGRWEPLPSSKLDPRAPAVFPASLEMAALAEAWADFRAEVAGFNRRAWEARTAADDEARRDAEERAERLRRERGTSKLLSD